MTKKALFLGCLVPLKYPQIEAAARLTMPALGVELVDLPAFSCCPDPVFFKSVDQMAWLTVAARNLAIAEAAGLDIATICSGCTATLAEAAHILDENAQLRAEINERLQAVGRKFDAKARVRHLATVLRDEVGYDKIANVVKLKLEGLKTAIFYGCHLLKPSDVAGVDDPDFPELQECLLRALGAELVEFAGRLACCGKGCPERAISSAIAADVVSSAVASGADILCLVCPSCFDSFELAQVTGRGKRASRQLPVVSYFQLLGLAMGFPQDKLGLQFHRVSVSSALARFGGK